MKKSLATFLSFLMLMSLSVSTFATEPEPSNDTRQVNGLTVSSSISNKQIKELPHATVDRLKETGLHISVERCADFASSGVTVSDQRCALFGSAVSL